MNDISDIGLLKREFRDARTVLLYLDHQVRKLVEPAAIHRPAGLTARFAACHLIARAEKRQPADVALAVFAIPVVVIFGVTGIVLGIRRLFSRR